MFAQGLRRLQWLPKASHPTFSACRASGFLTVASRFLELYHTVGAEF